MEHDDQSLEITDAVSRTGQESNFMISDLTYTPFARELVDIMYETYRDFWIDSPAHIPAFLKTEFFP